VAQSGRPVVALPAAPRRPLDTFGSTTTMNTNTDTNTNAEAGPDERRRLENGPGELAALMMCCCRRQSAGLSNHRQARWCLFMFMLLRL
jgi:hypothetical protein